MTDGNDNPWDADQGGSDLGEKGDPDGAEPDRADGPDDSNRPDDPNDPGQPESGDQGEPAAGDYTADYDEVDPNRNKVVLIALGAFVAIALIGFLLTRDTGNDSAANGGGGETAGTDDPQVAAPLVIHGSIDSFDRPDSTDDLGQFPDGPLWVVGERGGWGITGGTAFVANPDAERRNIAYIGVGHTDAAAQVKLTKVVPQSGLVFRYQAECSFWSIEAAPAAATWNVYKVMGCKAENMGNIGMTNVSDGVTIGVQMKGDTITIAIDGKVARTIEDSDLAGVGRVGMVAAGPKSGEARFDDFTGGSADGKGVVKPNDVPDATDAPAPTDAPGDAEAPGDGADVPVISE